MKASNRDGLQTPALQGRRGMGLMTAFGEGFLMTPLQLAGILSSIANGGTLYYLQYPRTDLEAEQFAPRVKRTLEIAPNGIEEHQPRHARLPWITWHCLGRANYDPKRIALRQDRNLHRFPALAFTWDGSALSPKSASANWW